MKKKTFYTEAAYIIGVFLLALGTAVTEKADFGVSMVVAPAYILYLKISEVLPFFTFGMAELMLQLTLMFSLVLITRRFTLSYVFSFFTVIIYGIVLDLSMFALSGFTVNSAVLRVVFFLSGLVITASGVSLWFHTYISPAVYEFFVKEVSSKFSLDINRFKTIYDLTSCFAAVVMSFILFGFLNFKGVKLGTVFCAFVNGALIGTITHLLEKRFEFSDRLSLRKYFL